MSAMESAARKRASSPDSTQDANRSKRQRTAPAETDTPMNSTAHALSAPNYECVKQVTAQDIGREGLKRSIALVLNHVGFDSASAEAMESMAETADTYISGFVDHLKRTANAARRDHPTPSDFETVLRRHNVPICSLEPHLQNPVRKKKRKVKEFYDAICQDFRAPQTAHPFLGPELDGTRDKETKAWIPSSFPGFPSKHSYKFTEMEPPVHARDKKREEAKAAAKKGEQALRRIDRAAKLSQQKELRELANRNPLSKKRHNQWESCMKDLLGDGSAGAGEIADHSTIVNTGVKHFRKEVPKSSRRGATDIITSKG